MGAIWGSFVGFLEWALLELSILTGSAGIGIIVFTIITRLVILPLTLTSIRSGRKMQELQPMIKELQRKYGKEPQKLQEETLKLYRTYKVNPAGSCLPLFLQLPIFLGIYQAVSHLMIPGWQHWLSPSVQEALANPSVQAIFQQPFLGLNLGLATFHQNAEQAWIFAGAAYLILPILSILLQLIQQVMATPRVQDPQQKAMMQAMLFMPIIFGYIAFTFPAGAVLYWVTSSLVGVVQQYFTSGWGSLVNYLKFLPPDNRPAPTLAVASALTTSTVSDSGAAAATSRQTFWDVLRPLTETDSPGSSGAANAADSTTSATEEAIEEARYQGKPQNPRRIRRRR